MNAARLAVVTAGIVLALVSPARADRWTAARALPEGRTSAGSAMLPDGDVLVLGGFVNDGSITPTGKRYDVTTNTWSPVAPMGVARSWPIVAVLADGRVLVAGGVVPGGGLVAATSAEVYDPAGNAWTPVTGVMGAPRLHTGIESGASQLPDGKVLLAGASVAMSAAVDVYDPATNAFTAAEPMSQARAQASQARLADGRVLVAGGADGAGALSSGEVFDPTDHHWTAVADTMASGHAAPAAVTLPDGRALVAGGQNGGSPTADSELYDPATNRFSPAGAMNQAGHTGGVVAQLADGRVFVAGGGGGTLGFDAPSLAATETFAPATGVWTSTAPLETAVRGASGGVLRDGRVLIAGGLSGPAPAADTQVYTPSTPPGSPRGPSATAGDGTAIVTWIAPADDGANPIQTYTVRASTGQQVTTSDARTAITLGGLANGTPVTFTVTAATSFATSAASVPTAPVTPVGAPSPAVPVPVPVPVPLPAPPPGAGPLPAPLRPAADRTAPTVRITGLPSRLTRSAFLRGRRVTLTPSEPARLVVTLVGPRNRTLLRRTFARSRTARKVALPSRMPVGPTRRFSVQLRIVATDAAGNRRTIRRTVRVQ
jgi:fibronectin type III domain protein/Kelch motif protein